MKKQLNKEQKGLTEKGIKNTIKQLETLKEEYHFNKDTYELNKLKREHECKWKEFIAEERNKKDNEILKQIEDQIKLKEESLKSMEKHLKEGVEPRENPLV